MLKFNSTKLLMLASAAIVAIPLATAVAGPATVPVTATFRQAISLATTSDLAFGKIDYVSATVTGSDKVVLAPDGTATPSGNFSLATGLPRTAGNVNVLTATTGLAASVYCSTSATLSDGSSHTITVNSIKFATNGGSATSCAGLGTGAGSFTLSGGGADNVTVGGTLDGGTASGGTIFPAAYTGSLQLDVIYD